MLPASTATRHSRLIAPLAIALMPLLGSVAMADTDARLADAAMKRDTAAVRALVEQKGDVNASGRDGTPALHWLVRVQARGHWCSSGRAHAVSALRTSNRRPEEG